MPIERDTVQDEAEAVDGSSITLRSDTNAVTITQFLVTHPGVASTPKDLCGLVEHNNEYRAVTDDKRIVSHVVSLPQHVSIEHDTWHVQYSDPMGDLLGLATTPDHTGRSSSVVRIVDPTKGALPRVQQQHQHHKR